MIAFALSGTGIWHLNAGMMVNGQVKGKYDIYDWRNVHMGIVKEQHSWSSHRAYGSIL